MIGMAMITIVHFVQSVLIAVISASKTAIPSAILTRVSEKSPLRRTASSLTRSTVPRWNARPSPAVATQRALGCPGGALLLEEAVHDGPGAAHVGPEGSELEQFLRERGGGQVVGGERRQIARAESVVQRGQEGAPPLVEARLPPTRVECLV